MNNQIKNIKKRPDELLLTLLDIWEKSVQQTHHFLKAGEINNLKPLVQKYLKMIPELCIYTDENENTIAFLGASNHKIEMLFVHPTFIGQGIGKSLIQHAINNWKINLVDVNEQNHSAVGFYQKMGFETIGRSELDDQGNPYPILHMELKNFPY